MVSLYDVVLKPEDKFILSKGHACYPLYVLLREKGYNPRISGHPDYDSENRLEATTGSLGHGLPLGVGMALAKKIKKQNGQIYVLLGCGECQEGTIWESSLIASHHKLNNLTAIVDYNKIQGSAKTNDVLFLGDLNQKFQSFGWHVLEIDGHNFQEIIPALQQPTYEKPKMIIANTIKGKGVSFMENNPDWHGLPDLKKLKQAYEELK